MHLNTKINNLEQVAKPIAGLNARIAQLQEQNQELHGWRQRAESFSIALEEEKRRQKTSAQDQHDREEDRGGEQVYKKEMERESSLEMWSNQVAKRNRPNSIPIDIKPKVEQGRTREFEIAGCQERVGTGSNRVQDERNGFQDPDQDFE